MRNLARRRLVPDRNRLAYEEPAGAHFEGLHYEAAAVARAISAGQLEVPQRPLTESNRTMAVADAIRNQLGIVFPGENPRNPRTSVHIHTAPSLADGKLRCSLWTSDC